MSERVTVIGAGLAGSEAAWQLAQSRIEVDLYEMRPTRMTEAHVTGQFGELVCSNSFGSDSPHTASSILKSEVAQLGGFVLGAARRFQVPAGASLAVDRDKFAAYLTEQIRANSLIKIHSEPLETIPEKTVTVVATGPLTSAGLAKALGEIVGSQSLYFYDAISPIVSADSLDMSKMFLANRYGKGGADFLNIPLEKEQYEALVDDLLTGQVVLPHDFEEEKYFEGCMPIEAIAARGRMTLAFGPMKPVGLHHPETGKRAYAVIQLRTENEFKTAYNLVGFQTKLKYGEQERVFRKLPGLENAEFLRLGSMHRNTYLNSPQVLYPTLQLRARPNVFIAGQLTGTEGYLESCASGLLAGINAGRLVRGENLLQPPRETMLGSLLSSITDPLRTPFQPMNSNMGILPPLTIPIREKKLRYAAYSDRAVKKIVEFCNVSGLRKNDEESSPVPGSHFAKFRPEPHVAPPTH